MSWQIQQERVSNPCPDCPNEKSQTRLICLGVKPDGILPPKDDVPKERDTIVQIWNNLFKVEKCDANNENQKFQRKKSGDGYFYFRILKGEEVGVTLQPNGSIQTPVGCLIYNDIELDAYPCSPDSSRQKFQVVNIPGDDKEEKEDWSWIWMLIGFVICLAVVCLFI